MFELCRVHRDYTNVDPFKNVLDRQAKVLRHSPIQFIGRLSAHRLDWQSVGVRQAEFPCCKL